MRKITKIVFEADKKNADGRIYDDECLNEIVKQWQQRVQEGNYVFGELGHPENPVISFNNVSHRIENVKVKDSNLMVDLLLLDTPASRVLELVEDKDLVILPRLRGTVDSNGYVNVDRWISFDIDIKY